MYISPLTQCSESLLYPCKNTSKIIIKILHLIQKYTCKIVRCSLEIKKFVKSPCTKNCMYPISRELVKVAYLCPFLFKTPKLNWPTLKKLCLPHQNQALREAFRIFDKDKSGYIEAREIALTAQALGEALSEAELREFMAEADLDGDGRLNYNEFVKIMTSKGDDWSL